MENTSTPQLTHMKLFQSRNNTGNMNFHLENGNSKMIDALKSCLFRSEQSKRSFVRQPGRS